MITGQRVNADFTSQQELPVKGSIAKDIINTVSAVVGRDEPGMYKTAGIQPTTATPYLSKSKKMWNFVAKLLSS